MANFYTDTAELKFHLTHPLMQKIVALRERQFTEQDQFDYAPVDFEDAMDSYDKVLEIVGDICANVVAPNAESVDAEGPQLINGHVQYARGTQENLEAIVKAGLMGITLPRKYNGLNFPIVPYIMAADMVSRADAGFVNIWGLQDCAETIHEFADEDQQARFLPRIAAGETAAMDLTEPDAGSDLQAVQLKATLADGKWYLNGVKRFITNGDGNISLVLARSEEGTADGRGLSMFIYDRNSDAVTVRRIEHKLGIIGSPTCELVFHNAPAELVGQRKFGLIKYVMALMNGARLGIAAQSVGIADAAWRAAKAYAEERVQFGSAINKFPAVYEMIARMKTKVDAIRSLLYETARFVDMYKTLEHIAKERALTPEEKTTAKYYQKLADIFTPLAKGLSAEICNQIAYDALQVHGGSGFMKDYPVERIYRDARITSIYEGTTQLQVVAAVRGVSTGGFLTRMREYEQMDVKPELTGYRNYIAEMTAEYEDAVKQVLETGNTEYTDFHARRLVEMAGNIIMAHLLVLDTDREHSYWKSLDIFLKIARGENRGKREFIAITNPADLGKYKPD